MSPLSIPPNTVERGPVWSVETIHGLIVRTLGGTGNSASTAWPTNNLAYAIPFQVPSPVAFNEMHCLSGTSPGTTAFDLGIYDDQFRLLSSIGATNAVNSTGIVQPAGGAALVPPVVLQRGRYYMAMSSASTALTVQMCPTLNSSLRALGVFQMASAHPLPATFVPASVGTLLNLPLLAMDTITNIL